MPSRLTLMRTAAICLCAIVAAVADAPPATAADYVPYLPDTTSFAGAFVGQVHHFFAPGNCLERSLGNLEDEQEFLGYYLPYTITYHMIMRIGFAADMLPKAGKDVPLVALVAAGWSFPDSLTVTFSLVDTTGGGFNHYTETVEFQDDLPEFMDVDVEDTTSVQQVNLFLQFERTIGPGKTIKQVGARGMSADTVTDPESRPAGTSIIDIVDVSDKRKGAGTADLPLELLAVIRNTGTGGAVGYRAVVPSLIGLNELPDALPGAQVLLLADWDQLRHAVMNNIGAILGYYAQPLTPCGQGGGLVVFVHDEGTTCDGGQNPNCVIYGDGETIGLPIATAIALQGLSARTAPGAIRVSWEMPSEFPGAGFHVYRAETSQPAIERRLTEAPLTGGPILEYVDRQIEAGTEYAYAIGAIDRDGVETRFGPVIVRAAAAARLSLAQNAPNPFQQLTVIRFEVASDGCRTALRVYDASGRAVRTLMDGRLSPGSYQATWDGRDDAGRAMPSGVYVCSFDNGKAQARKMILRR